MSLLTISCWFYDRPYTIFNIETNPDAFVLNLQTQILERKKNRIAGLDENDLVLWKVPFDYDNGSAVDNIKLGSGVGGATQLTADARICSVFPSTDVDNHLLVIQLPPKLLCWVYGLPEESINELQLRRRGSDNVYDLKKMIKEQNSDMFESYVERDIVLWKVPFNNNNDSINDIKLENGLGGVVELTVDAARVRSVFPSKDVKNHLLIIQLPPKLSCWVHGLLKKKRFELQPRFSDHVSDLKKRIKEQKRDMFDKYEERDIALWKVPFNNDNDSINNLKLEDGVGGVVELTADARVRSVFPSKEVDNHLLVIQIPKKLSCWVYGLPEESIFELQLRSGDRVSDLKKRIKEQNSDMFDKYAERDIALWKVPFNDNNDSVDDIKLVHKVDGPTKLLRRALVSNVFLSKDVDNHLLVIQLPPKLLYCALGQSKEARFELQPHSDDNVGRLKEMIKEASRPYFDSVPTSHLILWKVEIDLKTQDIPANLQGMPAGARKLQHEEKVQSIFPEPMPDDRLSIVIDVLDLGSPFRGPIRSYEANEANRNVPALKKKFLNALDKMSKALVSDGYLNSQISDCICDGRYEEKDPKSTILAPPVQLFHPVFAHFLDDLAKDHEIPEDYTDKVTNYMIKASAIYDTEKDRCDVLTPLLGDLLDSDIELISDHNMGLNGIVETKTPAGNHAVILVNEDKNKFGDGSCNSSKQVGLSMVWYWTQSRFRRIRNNTCCPTFLITNAGPWITIHGAVFTDIVIIQRLTDYVWIGLDSALNKLQFERVARTFSSVRDGVSRLKDYYNRAELSAEADISGSRFFPSITEYHNSSGDGIQFEYTGFMENNSCCVTLRARTLKERQEIVVKFVDRYGKEAHEVLARENRAPQLYYCGPPCVDLQGPSYKGILMVVMEYIDGKIVNKVARTIGLKKVKEELKELVDILHGNGFVFGDLRIPNVMVTTEGRVKLVDFDWAGIDGETRYPHLISPMIRWPKGVKGCSVMKKEHDTEMMRILLGKLGI